VVYQVTRQNPARHTLSTDHVLLLDPPAHVLRLQFRHLTRTTEGDLNHSLLSQGHVQGHRRRAQGHGLMSISVLGQGHKM